MSAYGNRCSARMVVDCPHVADSSGRCRVHPPDSDSEREFKNHVCDEVYRWLKGDGPEPYAPAVGSLLNLVLRLIDEDRARRTP